MKRATKATPAGVPRSRAKLTKRQRYILKWNGPYCLDGRMRRATKAMLGKGTESERDAAYFYECRYRGHHPSVEFVYSPNRISVKHGRNTQARRHT
jgi:hypothetical protein